LESFSRIPLLSPEALRPDIEAQGFMVKVWLVAH
jgi:hypothetical protein